jgi:signal transduction histidine kinase/DNA-binding NarL/FixJ family response regulator
MKTVLVLAEHPDLAELVRMALDAGEYRVVLRGDTEEAEPFLRPGAIDACVIDAENNGVQGLWMVERTRRALPQCPVLVVAGSNPWEWEEQAYAVGVSHVLPRPIRQAVLKTLLERVTASPDTVSIRPSRGSSLRRPASRTSNRRDAESARAPVRTLEVLRDFSAILTHSLCAEGMLKQFLLLLREIIGVNRAAIFLRPPSSGFSTKTPADGARRFHLACAIGLAPGLLDHFELSVEAGLGGFLYREGRILRKDSPEVDEDGEMQKEFDLMGVEVVIPILDRETFIGIAAFGGRVTGEPLDNAELELIFHLLEQLGLAVRNIWLHDQLSANHEMMADILRQLSSACVVIDRDLNILHCNKTARNYFAKGSRKSADMDFSDLPQALGGKVFQVLKTGTGIAPFKYQPAESPQTVYQISIVPFQRQDSVLPASVLLVAEDHSQREQLQQLEIEAANLRLVRTMADRLAHEVGNALVPISTHQQLLAEKYKDPEFRTSLGVALADGVKRVTRLINQMRFLARDASEAREAFPLGPLIEEAYLEAQRYQPVKSGRLVLDLDGAPVLLSGDRAALKHAFAEVLLNALQANPADAVVTVRVHIAANEMPVGTTTGNTAGLAPFGNGKALLVEIQDNGGGFSAEAAAKVPQPFFTTRNVGLGLGMTVSRRIIETHRGQLSVLSPRAGQPGVVRISLPVQESSAEVRSGNGTARH